MISKGQRALYVWHYLGASWVAYRTMYALRSKTGALRRRMPSAEWTEYSLRSCIQVPELRDPEALLEHRRTRGPAFFFSPAERTCYQPFFARWDAGEENPLVEASLLKGGKFRLFENEVVHAGLPPEWNRDPLSGAGIPANIHWSEINEFAYGDVKLVWELSRFAFTYPLVRAYWRTGDESLAEHFWSLVEDWKTHNLPNRGPNWKCGQETAFRVMAWCFGLYGFLDAACTTADRVASLVQMITASGERIEKNFAYARSQQNNHGISEAAGLWTIGILFPEISHAARWREKGHAALEELLAELVYDDGSFSQHSMNYHRLMLHDYTWVLALADRHNASFSPEVRERVSRAANFLVQVQDESTGCVPCYGQNDGALILPLSNCAYTDYRPVLQASHYLSSRARLYEQGPWDEDLLWLFGRESLAAPVVPPERKDLRAEDGGYYTLRGANGFAFARCAEFRHRPGQADMLHTDIWWRGENIAIDPGTYSYNAAPPWDNALAGTLYHNTVTVDGKDQMARAERFLWLPWAQGTLQYNLASNAGFLSYWEAGHDGYCRLTDPVVHRRGILRLGSEHWLVVDGLCGREPHDFRLHWLFPDLEHEWDDAGTLQLAARHGNYIVRSWSTAPDIQYSLMRSDEKSPRGWRAESYASKAPALSLDAVVRSRSALFLTLLGPAARVVSVDEGVLEIEIAGADVIVSIGSACAGDLVRAATVTGVVEDEMELPQ